MIAIQCPELVLVLSSWFILLENTCFGREPAVLGFMYCNGRVFSLAMISSKDFIGIQQLFNCGEPLDSAQMSGSYDCHGVYLVTASAGYHEPLMSHPKGNLELQSESLPAPTASGFPQVLWAFPSPFDGTLALK